LILKQTCHCSHIYLQIWFFIRAASVWSGEDSDECD
jgi:hypothetical protein